jgi:LuxR family transcriptional regulator, maltose regulon positive regulatory protein
MPCRGRVQNDGVATGVENVRWLAEMARLLSRTRVAATVPAKICAPRLTEVYQRPRLFRALDAARRRRAVWITAPAGAGKTSVVITYVAARRLRYLWYNVDARDADVANLFHYLRMAAELAVGKRKIRLPQFSAENQAGAGAFARSFFETLCAEIRAPHVLVFDDYQEAKSNIWDEVMREALHALAGAVTAIVISRTAPPASLARDVASGNISLLGWDDLRLSAREMTGLVSLYRPDLSSAEQRGVLSRIFELANGWAAALTMLLQNRRLTEIDATGAEEFSEQLFDYFAAEILDKTTPAQRDFLLRTSVVPTVTTALAAKLSGAADASRILDDFDRRSFLTQRLGASDAYRYHPLLRGFLVRRAQMELGGVTVRALHRRAAELLSESGQIDDAMDQFERAGEVVERARLLLRVAPAYLAKGSSRTVEEWIRRLPIEWVERDGWLMYWHALSCMGHVPARAHELCDRAYLQFVQADDVEGIHHAAVAAIQAIVCEGMDFGQLAPWVDRIEALQQQGRDCSESFGPMVATGMLIAAVFCPRTPVADRAAAERAMRLAMVSDDVAHRLMSGGFLVIYFVFRGSLAEAMVILEMLRASARTAASPVAALSLLMAETLCTWVRGDNDACLLHVREALTIADKTGIFVWNDYLCASGAAAALGAENSAAAREFIERMAYAAQSGRVFSVGTYHCYWGWDAMVRGDTAGALRSAELACEAADRVRSPFARSITTLALATMLWRAGRKAEARQAIERSRQRARETADTLILHGCDLAEADLAWDDDRMRALTCLRRGFALARRRGYHNMFWLGNSVMKRLSVRALEHAIEPEFVRMHVAQHRLKPDGLLASGAAWPWCYRFRALGAFEISREEETPSGNGASAGAKGLRGAQLRMLKAILAFGARDVGETELVDALWPDAQGDAGRRAFDTALHRLRRQLGDDEVVRVRDGRVYLDDALCWVDIWELEQLAEQVEGDVSRSAPSATLLETGERLLALYRGPLLADEEGAESWAVKPRARLDAQFRGAVERLAGALEQQGNAHDATNFLERARERGRENLSRRLRQTLDGLMRGMSEKELASELALSPHTLHGYVKTLYRRLGVSSRGELHARFGRWLS